MPVTAKAAEIEQILERAKMYHNIKARLHRQLGRRWPVGTRLPSIRELAKELKAGQTNTHRAVKELARVGLLVSRTGQGTFVTESASVGTSMMGAGGEDSDALVPDVIKRPAPGALAGMTVKVLTAVAEPDQIIRRMVDAVEKVLRADGATVLHAIYPYYGSADRMAAHHDVDGLVIINPDARSLQCGPRQVLCVINTAIETSVAMTTGYDVVSADSEQGGFVAGQHMKRCGVKSVCFIGCR